MKKKNWNSQLNNKSLFKRAKAIRFHILDMANRSRSAHVGSSLSCVDIMTYLFFLELRIDSKNSKSSDRDYFILSKGHAAMTLYATLAERGIISFNLLTGYFQEEGTLPGHLDRFSSPGIEVSTGSLGHGLPIGLGLAHGFKLKGKPNRVFVLMGDGESQEGSVWEAAMMAPKLSVDNLIAIIDHNNLQGYGRPSEIMHFRPVVEKWNAFGWHAQEINGHHFDEFKEAFKIANCSRKPSIIILRTIKGKGISFMEDELKWHYFNVTDELLEQAKRELNNA